MLFEDDSVKLRKDRHPQLVTRITLGAAIGGVLMFVLLMSGVPQEDADARIARDAHPVPTSMTMALIDLPADQMTPRS